MTRRPARLLSLLVAAFAANEGGSACTTVLVGKGLTVDGSVIHAHNEDMGNDAVGRLWSVAPAEHGAGTALTVPYVELPQVDRTLGYWASGNAPGTAGLETSPEVRAHDSVLVGLNERGVSLSCNWAWSREENREGIGIRRYAIRQLLLERATSARHGVEILGALIDSYGQADWGGLIYHLADPDEAWVVETTTRNWVARRLRDDEMRVTANRFRIGDDYDLASATLVEHAVAAGWLAAPAERLDFAAVYGRPGKMDQPYDSRREDRVAGLLEPRLGEITPAELFAVLRDRYDGTPYYTPPQPGPVWREDLDRNAAISRTISTNLAQSSFVAHLRGDLPVAVGAVMWLGMATPDHAGYVPLYAGGGGLPAAYGDAALEADEISAWWLFRRLQRLADPQHQRIGSRLREFWRRHHLAAFGHQHPVEAAALERLAAGDPAAARRLLSTFTRDQAVEALHHARQLLELLAAGGDDDAQEDRQILNRGAGKERWWDALPRNAWCGYRPIEQSQAWFEVHEIRPGVIAIYEPGQFEEVISYLVVGSERALLFDSGLGIGDMRRLVGELTDREVVVLNSHTHYDHVGGNWAFDEVWGTGLDFTRASAAGRSRHQVAEFVGPGWIWKRTPPGFAAADYRSRPFTIRRPVADGQIIALGGVDLEVLLTPGHAPDSLCLLDRRRRLLFTGDTFYPATLYAHLPGTDFTAYQETAERLAALAGTVDLVLPAHNEPAMTAGDLVDLRDAFRAVRAGAAPFVLTDGNREYSFGRFSILVPEPPPWEPD